MAFLLSFSELNEYNSNDFKFPDVAHCSKQMCTALPSHMDWSQWKPFDKFPKDTSDSISRDQCDTRRLCFISDITVCYLILT